MPGVSVRIGAASAPAMPASRLPAPNTPAYTSVVLMPSAPTICGLIAAARTTLPSRVLLMPNHSRTATTNEMPIMNR